MMDLDQAGRRPLGRKAGAAFARTAATAVLVAAALLVGQPAANAMGVAKPPAFKGPSIVIDVLTTCDTRGCFTFGPRQSYQRPNYRPVGPIGPGAQSPRAARPPRFIFRPQTPAPLPQARLPAADPSFHRQSCMNRYRSYNPLTDTYISSGRKTVRCVLPERR